MTVETKLTYEDYAALPNDGRRYEIIDGELSVSPSPSRKHQNVLANLIELIRPFVRKQRLGQLFCAPFDVVLAEHDVVQPDLIFVSAARSDIVSDSNIKGTPDLLIEILSEFHRKDDEVVKRRRYESCGVAEYWIVDPELEIVKIDRLNASGRYDRIAEIGSGTITTPLLPGLSIDVTDVFSAQ